MYLVISQLLRFILSHREPSFELLTMAPSGIERIDNKAGKNQFENRLHSADIKLSEVMATSAAAVSYHMGKRQSKFKPLQSLQVILGLGLGKSQIVEPRLCSRCLTSVHWYYVTPNIAHHITSHHVMQHHIMHLKVSWKKATVIWER